MIGLAVSLGQNISPTYDNLRDCLQVPPKFLTKLQQNAPRQSQCSGSSSSAISFTSLILRTVKHIG